MQRGNRRFVYTAVGGFLLLCAAAALYDAYSQQKTFTSDTAIAHTIQLKGETIRITVADTSASREKGLGGRDNLASDEGMLFVFPEDGTYSFWMKDMRFSIDILWLSKSGEVVDMVQNVSPDTYPSAFTPQKPARYVLELPAAWSDAHGVSVGDIVRL